MHNDSLLYRLLGSTIVLLLIIGAALPAVMQDNSGAASPVANDTFELTGILESINNQEVVVDGVPVDIRIADLNVRLTLGDIVTVEGSLSDGNFTASRVRAPNVPDLAASPAGTANESSGMGDTGDNFEFRGIIDRVDDGFVIVSGQPVNTANMETRTPLVVNQMVRVRGVLQSGVFAAREIRLPNDDGFFDDDFDDRFGEASRSLSIPASCTVSIPAGWVTYTVRRGDTLSSIAARSGSQVSELVRVNCLVNPRMIIAGSTLILPRIPVSLPAVGIGNESSGSRSISIPSSSPSSRPSSPSSSSRSNESSGSYSYSDSNSYSYSDS
jgi:LysM repeat protein